MSMLQIGMLGMIGALLSVQLKSMRAEYGIYISVAVGIVLFTCIIDRLEIFLDTIGKIQKFVTIDKTYINVMLKMIGVTYIAEFSSGICKDTGHQTLAVQIEVFGKLTILALGMPVLLALLETIQEFLS